MTRTFFLALVLTACSSVDGPSGVEGPQSWPDLPAGLPAPLNPAQADCQAWMRARCRRAAECGDTDGWQECHRTGYQWCATVSRETSPGLVDCLAAENARECRATTPGACVGLFD